MNKTVKLYYIDSYISSFSAEVLSSSQRVDGRYESVLKETAFFPTEGGQSADGGYIGEEPVLDAEEREGVIYHITERPIATGVYSAKINFDERFEKMQCHTAEHILSGIFHSEYSIENVGFHLGKDEITLDTSRPVSREMLTRVEALANEAVFANLPVRAVIYSNEEAKKHFYRSKIELEEDIRVVTIEGVDDCACCAPHVGRTGEIGLIKIIKAEKHKSGSRLYMTAGRRAYKWLSEILLGVDEISRLLSSPPQLIAEECKKLYSVKNETDTELSRRNAAYARLVGESIPKTSGNKVIFIGGLDSFALRECANAASASVEGLTVAITERESGFSYCIVSKNTDDIRDAVKNANTALLGRGGGRGNMAEGFFGKDKDAIFKYFEA